MITSLSLLALLTFNAAGDIYHCAGKDGAMVFQDKPCAATRSVLLSTKSKSADGDLIKLRQALKKIERAMPMAPATARTTVRSVSSLPLRNWSNRGPADQGLLAACSSRFFDCASGDALRMDRCVAVIPRCGAGRSTACCPDECVTRYLDLRRAKFPPAQSVRDALLDDSVGSCAAR